MGFLTNLLPGLRDLRTPLTAGYAWLLGLWLVFADSPSLQAPVGKLRRVFDPVTTYYGKAIVVAATTVVAYLVGSLITIDVARVALPWWARLGPEIWRRITDRGVRTEGHWIATAGSAVFRLRTSDVERYVRFVREEPGELNRAVERPSRPLESPVSADASAFEALESIDVPGLAIRLHIKNKDLWDQYDRYAAEAELRLSLIAPLLLISAGLAWQLRSLVVLVLGAAISFLMNQAGDIRARLANGVLVQCLVTKVIEDARIDALRGAPVRDEQPAMTAAELQ